MSVATREQLLGGFVRRFMECPLPASGLVIRIQNLTQKERAAYEELSFDEDGDRRIDQIKMRDLNLLVRVIVDDTGRRMFSDNDTDLLTSLDGGDMDLAFAAAREHCGFNYRIETAKKN